MDCPNRFSFDGHPSKFIDCFDCKFRVSTINEPFFCNSKNYPNSNPAQSKILNEQVVWKFFRSSRKGEWKLAQNRKMKNREQN